VEIKKGGKWDDVIPVQDCGGVNFPQVVHPLVIGVHSLKATLPNLISLSGAATAEDR
jgi:hypothetical protein